MTKNQKILAGVAVAGLAYYFWKRSKKEATSAPIMQTRPAMVEGEAMSEALGISSTGRKGVFYGNSACSKNGKIFIACGQSCPDGSTKVSGSHQRC